MTTPFDPICENIAQRVADLLRGGQARLLSINDAARYLGVSRRTLEGLISTGKVPTVREGSIKRLDRGDLDQWIEMRKGKI